MMKPNIQHGIKLACAKFCGQKQISTKLGLILGLVISCSISLQIWGFYYTMVIKLYRCKEGVKFKHQIIVLNFLLMNLWQENFWQTIVHNHEQLYTSLPMLAGLLQLNLWLHFRLEIVLENLLPINLQLHIRLLNLKILWIIMPVNLRLEILLQLNFKLENLLPKKLDQQQFLKHLLEVYQILMLNLEQL